MAALATRDTWGLSRAVGAPCVGGDPSGQSGHGATLAPLHIVATENCVPCVHSCLSQGVAAGGEVVRCPPGSLLLSALLCGVDLWKGRVGSSQGSEVLGE